MTVPSKGWFAQVTHPDTSRTLKASPLADPRIEPSINSLPRINIPVPRAAFWQDLTSQPAMSVYLDGAEQPIDELVNVRDRRDQAASVLVGRGGVELLGTAEVEFDSEYRHTAVQQVIQNQTTYTADIATPSFDTLTDEDMQDPSTTVEFNAVTGGFPADLPAEVGTDQINPLQTAFFTEAENASSETGGRGTTGTEDDDYSNDAGEVLESTGDRREYEFTPDHTIPGENVAIKARVGLNSGNQSAPAFTWALDGTAFDSLGTAGTTLAALGWDDVGDGFYSGGDGYTGGDISAGQTVTLSVEVDDGGDAADIYPIDGVVLYDDRYNHDSARTGNTFDNDTGATSYLDDPRSFAAVDIVFDAETTPFALVAGTVSVSMDATTNDQRVQIRNGVDATWLPNDGTEENTASVTVDPFPSAGDRIQLRVTSSSHSPSGAQAATPRFGYAGQSIQSYDLDADIEQTSLLLDYRNDGSIQNILTDIVGESFVWSYRVDSGTETVTVTQPGQRTTDAKTGLIEADPEKDLDTYHQADVQGSNRSVSGEQFSASLSQVNLTFDDLIPGSESVRDPDDGTQYTRGEDYTMDWTEGEITATEDGALVIGDTYEISYGAETRGSYTDPNAPAGHRTYPVDIPEVTSDRNAEQIAYVLVQDLKDPRWIIDVTIPPSVTDFDAVEALSLSQLDIPSGSGPFFVSEPPRETPRGTEFRLVSQYESQRRVRQIRRQVSEVVRRTG